MLRALLQQVCLKILELTASFGQELRSDANSLEDRKHATQMYVDVVAIAKRTKDAQEHCNAHLEAMVSSCIVDSFSMWWLMCASMCRPCRCLLVCLRLSVWSSILHMCCCQTNV